MRRDWLTGEPPKMKPFYEGKLGLHFVSDDPFALFEVQIYPVMGEKLTYNPVV